MPGLLTCAACGAPKDLPKSLGRPFRINHVPLSPEIAELNRKAQRLIRDWLEERAREKEERIRGALLKVLPAWVLDAMVRTRSKRLMNLFSAKAEILVGKGFEMLVVYRRGIPAAWADLRTPETAFTGGPHGPF